MSPHPSPQPPHPRPKWPFWPHDPMLMLLGTDWMVNTMFFCDALTMVKTTNYGELMTGQDVLKFPCISDSVFCIIWCWGNFEQKLTSLTQKSRRLQDFYFRVNFHSRLGGEHLATAFIMFIWKSEAILWKYYQPSQWSRSQCKSICATTSKEKKNVFYSLAVDIREVLNTVMFRI